MNVRMLGMVLMGCALSAEALTTNEINQAHAEVKARYLRYLKGTTNSFNGTLGEEVANIFVSRVNTRVSGAAAFDYAADTNVVFSLFPGEIGFEEEKEVYDAMLQSWIPGLAYAYAVDAPGNAHYLDPEVKALYLRALDYLRGRGIKSGMTFHRNANRQLNNPPPAGCANIVDMELRMGSLCQSLLLMEEHVADEPIFQEMVRLVEFLEMLGYSSGHVQYWVPYDPPPGWDHLVQSDAMQIYPDVTFVSALFKTNAVERHEALLDASAVFTDSLKVVPGWADTIKPDFTGFHHRAIYGNSYTGGFMPQAAFGIHVLADTPYAVAPASIDNLRELALTYRLYSLKYAMPHGIRGRFPEQTDVIREKAFGTYVLFAAEQGLDDASMRPVFEALWDSAEVGVGFVFDGGRGKILRGLYLSDLLAELTASTIVPEPRPEGFWMKPYGGLAIHRRDDWMAAVKGHNKYVWDYETGSKQNEYGQYASHGMLTVFKGDAENTDVESGYDVARGWDWYRQPGTTAVRFPLRARQVETHRLFSAETFMGGVSMRGRDGVFGMILNDPEFGDGERIDLKARKSYFFQDDLIVMLGSDISGGDGTNAVETTLFQSARGTVSRAMKKNGQIFADGAETLAVSESVSLVDPFGNGYYVPDASGVELFQGQQQSFDDNGTTPTVGDYSTVVFNHGLSPTSAVYEAAMLVSGEDELDALTASPESYYQIGRMDASAHQVHLTRAGSTAYVVFESTSFTNGLIESAETPCLIMIQPNGTGWTVNCANPDLGLVDEGFEVEYRWIADDDNQYRPSTVKPVEVRVRGLWVLSADADPAVSVARYENGATVLRFACVDGAEISAELAPYGEATSALAFSAVVFADDFEDYDVDQPIPVGVKWTSSSYFEPSNVFVHARADVNEVFGRGAMNRYLGYRDAGGRGSNLVAKDVVETDAARLSFDFLEPDNGLTGSLSVRVGFDDVRIKESDGQYEVVGGVRPVDEELQPNGDYVYGEVAHADVFFNERPEAITYIGPDGDPETLASGRMDVWIDGVRTADDVVNNRFLGGESLGAIRSLRFESYSAGENEVWFDNVELAVGVPLSMGDSYDAWAERHGLAADERGETADPDGDGLDNLAEFAFGGDPTDPADVEAFKPRWVLGEGELEHVHHERVDAPMVGLTYFVETTTNLVEGVWGTNDIARIGTGSAENSVAPITNALQETSAPRRFVRVRVVTEE